MKKVQLPHGRSEILLDVPDGVAVLRANKAEAIGDPVGQMCECLSKPIGTRSLAKLAKGCEDAGIVVSDNTRPIPYSEPDGILAPIIETLQKSGVGKIKIIVACGTHLPMEEAELREMLGRSAFQAGVDVINHVATDESMLRSIGNTKWTPNVTVNRYYLDAELKIVTGLVEPHFMAGVSGGRKAICPGICGQSVVYGFHGAKILNEEKTANMVLECNPCHEEALRVARMAGVDFNVSVTIDSQKRINGIFCGELEESHLAAAKHLQSFSTIVLDRSYEIAITQGGIVGMNHYQCAKAALEGANAVKLGGKVVLVSDLMDRDPIGGVYYKDMLRLCVRVGYKEFCRRILADDWRFVPEQWEVQMWTRVYKQLGTAKNVYFCAPQLENYGADLIPEVNVAGDIKRNAGESNHDYAGRMLQQTVDEIMQRVVPEDVLILPDGPYAAVELKVKS